MAHQNKMAAAQEVAQEVQADEAHSGDKTRENVVTSSKTDHQGLKTSDSGPPDWGEAKKKTKPSATEEGGSEVVNPRARRRSIKELVTSFESKMSPFS